jgi:hypothetical protein
MVFRVASGDIGDALEYDDYVIDVFDSAIESADDAHLTTHTCDTREHVLAFCTHYDRISVL